MNIRQRAIKIIEKLPEKKLPAALYILEQLSLGDKGADEMSEILHESLELLGALRVAETAFSDWDNEEDSVYDDV